jgi:phenylalanyl-tRNA synthetase beta chain
MKLSIRWLKQFLGDAEVPVIIDALTRAGIEVEEALDLGMISGKIVVARVLEVQDHPNADKLHVCRVDVGQAEPITIVCGAPNVQAGVNYPCALPGAVLPDGTEIKRAKLRGQESAGMLCSARELGLGSDHSGILPLPDGWKIGEPFDAILGLKITPNRPDWLSVTGVARELAAMTGRQVHVPKPRFKETIERIEGYVQLVVQARAECPRYACRLIRGVKVAESPVWLKRALEASGLRPINNVVDVTNFVLMELGHPLHAFDFKRLKGGEVFVRMARAGESLVLIDGTEIKLVPEDLVIADALDPAALAGIMGGRATEVSDATTDVLLESAWFDPGTIRRSARRHGLSTDASYRFERGADRERLALALGRAAQLIQEVAGGEVLKGAIDMQAPMTDPSPIALEVGRVNARLGIKLSSSEIARFLVALGFEIRRADGDHLIVVVPSHRVDVARDVDLIEEVARLHGYDRIASTLPRVQSPPEAPDPIERACEQALDAMVALGFLEAVNYSFIGEAQAVAAGADPATLARLAKPLSPDQAVMRPGLLPGLLATAAYNRKQGESRLMLCEVGKAWRPGAQAGDPAGEFQEAALLWAGPTPLFWDGPSRETDFYDLKGAVEAVLATFGPEPLTCAPLADSPAFHPGRSASLSWKGRLLGQMGEIHPDLAAHFDLKERVHAARLDLTVLVEAWGEALPAIKPAPKFPGSWRDLALVMDAQVPAGEVLAVVGDAGRGLIEDVAVVDVYQGEHVAEGKKSLALRLRLRSPERTLTEDEIQGVVDDVVKKLGKQFGATLRG